VRDREADAADPDRIRFSPSILPPYMRRSKSIETPVADPLPEG
jgi:putative transposase